MTYLASSLCGQVMVEKARREGIRAAMRAADAKKIEAELAKRLDSLTSFSSIEEWAKTHGFFAPDQLVKPDAHGQEPAAAVVDPSPNARHKASKHMKKVEAEVGSPR